MPIFPFPPFRKWGLNLIKAFCWGDDGYRLLRKNPVILGLISWVGKALPTKKHKKTFRGDRILWNGTSIRYMKHMKMLKYMMSLVWQLAFGNPVFFRRIALLRSWFTFWSCKMEPKIPHTDVIWCLPLSSYSDVCGALGTTFFHP